MRRLGSSAVVSFITRTTAACSGMITTRVNTALTATRTTATTKSTPPTLTPTPSAPLSAATTACSNANANATMDSSRGVTLDAAGVWVGGGGGGGAMRAAVEAVLRRCRCDEIKEQSSSIEGRHKRGSNSQRECAEQEELPLPMSSMAVTMVLRAVYTHFSTPRFLRNNNNNRHTASNQTLTRLSEDIIDGNWERIARRFNYSLKKVPALPGYALPAEEIAAMARDVGHPLRRLVNQISYAEHGAVDVSGLYRQVRHAAYAPPVVVPDAEVAAFAQCLLQQTSAIEHALATSATMTTTTAEETTPKRPKKTKRGRSSSGTTKDECGMEPAINDALLDIFNQAVRASVPTCAEWAYTHAMIADVTAAARALISAGSAGDSDEGTNHFTNTTNKKNSTTAALHSYRCPQEITAEELKRKTVAQQAITAAARRVLDALVAANGRILGTIAFAGGNALAGCATPALSAEDAAISTPPCTATNNAPSEALVEGDDDAVAQQPPLLSWFTSVPGKAARADTVYVRAVYEQIWALLSDPKQSFGWDLPITESAFLLLVGSPGIGKSWALNYLLYKAVTEVRAGCPKRLVMLWGVGGLWAFLPDGRVIHGGLRGPTHQHPPKELIKTLVARYAPAPAAANVDQSGDGPKTTGATPTSDAANAGSDTGPLPALLLYDLGMERVDPIDVPNMITVIAASPPRKKIEGIDEDFYLTTSTFYMPPFGEHEFKAFFKGHPDVKRALDVIKKNNSLSPIAVEESAADALVAQEFEKYGGVLQGAFDGQQASLLQHALDEAVAEAVVAGFSDDLDHFYWHNESVHTAAARLMSIFPQTREPIAELPMSLPAREFASFSVGFRSKHIESLFKKQLERAVALVAVRREMDKLGCPREY